MYPPFTMDWTAWGYAWDELVRDFKEFIGGAEVPDVNPFPDVMTPLENVSKKIIIVTGLGMLIYLIVKVKK